MILSYLIWYSITLYCIKSYYCYSLNLSDGSSTQLAKLRRLLQRSRSHGLPIPNERRRETCFPRDTSVSNVRALRPFCGNQGGFHPFLSVRFHPMGGIPRHPQHGWPWLSIEHIETSGDLGLPNFKKPPDLVDTGHHQPTIGLVHAIRSFYRSSLRLYETRQCFERLESSRQPHGRMFVESWKLDRWTVRNPTNHLAQHPLLTCQTICGLWKCPARSPLWRMLGTHCRYGRPSNLLD